MNHRLKLREVVEFSLRGSTTPLFSLDVDPETIFNEQRVVVELHTVGITNSIVHGVKLKINGSI